MPVTNYHTLNGRIRGETTNGVRTNYLSDALGSVTGTVNSSAQIQNRYRNRPYGARLYKSGTAANPRFQWNGSWGYLDVRRTNATQYVRARSYDEATGRWTTVDPLWPLEKNYGYVGANPATYSDPPGLAGMIVPILVVGGVIVHDALCALGASRGAHQIELSWFPQKRKTNNGYRPLTPEEAYHNHNLVDKLEHCYTYCVAYLCSISRVAATVTGASEWGPSRWQPGESEKDIEANKAGIACAQSFWIHTATACFFGPGNLYNKLAAGSDCLECCKKKRLDQKLDGNPPYPEFRHRPLAEPPVLPRDPSQIRPGEIGPGGRIG